ncbi:Uncharacterized membrane-anchored protein [Nitrosospira multiformis]|uniref:Uncharacterized membrane-anchored protein n=1 Tax=Nitrosospira multiformis TaxID=1231 RepID=A0A1H8MMB9_9PROT|nr:DUF2167 domain-containing protein [Nitrosospira multiformis]SEO18388.1 Uncharacterized membrane-anchored protein [Nitrosospira multiformis]
MRIEHWKLTDCDTCAATYARFVKWMQLTCLAAVLFIGGINLVNAAQDEQETEKILGSLNWIEGPQEVNIEGKASFSIPTGYVFLNPADTKRFMEVIHNPSTGKAYLIAPQDLHWFSLLNFEETGYVKDDENIDPEAILSSIRENTEQGNVERRAKGWETMSVLGWKLPPYYDAVTKRLEWAIDARSSNDEAIINLNTRILGRTGVTSAVLVASPEIFSTSTQEFKDALTGYEYISGEKYTEFRQGDRVAEYGLAALIAGGAAAVASKKGLWAMIAGFFAAFWKVIAGVIVAGFAGLISIFRKKKE